MLTSLRTPPKQSCLEETPTTKFEQLAKEKHYLLGVSPATLEWYRHSLRWLETEEPNENELKRAVLRMREARCKPSACNSYLRAINSYLKWSGSSLKAPKLKEEQRVLPTFSVEDIQKIIAWKPKTYGERRLHTANSHHAHQ